MMQKFPIYAYIPAKDMARARKFYEEFKDTEGNIMALIEGDC